MSGNALDDVGHDAESGEVAGTKHAKVSMMTVIIQYVCTALVGVLTVVVRQRRATRPG